MWRAALHLGLATPSVTHRQQHISRRLQQLLDVKVLFRHQLLNFQLCCPLPHPKLCVRHDKTSNLFLMTVLPNPGSCPMPFRVCFVFRHSEPVLCQRIIIYIIHHSFAYLTRISHPSWIQVQSIMNRLCTSSKVLILDTSIGL